MIRKSLRVILLLITSGFVLNEASVVWSHYSFHDDRLTWEQARESCRGEHGRDLATIYTQSDEAFLGPHRLDTWIGYYKNGHHWDWCQASSNNFHKWAHHEPGHGERCAVLSHHDKKMRGARCEDEAFFLCEDISNGVSKYVYVSEMMKWIDADQYCQHHYHDLAVLTSDADIDSAVNSEDYLLWIGLHKEAEEWLWSPGLYGYRNWAQGQPGNHGDCVAISSKTKEMSTQSCNMRLPYFCLKDNVVLVNENKTWEEALDHCRAISDWPGYDFDLLSVTSDDDYIWKVIEVSLTEQVWVGLRFMAGNWLWVDQKDSLPNEQPVCLEENLQCGTISKNKTRGVENLDPSLIHMFSFSAFLLMTPSVLGSWQRLVHSVKQFGFPRGQLGLMLINCVGPDGFRLQQPELSDPKHVRLRLREAADTEFTFT
ncbi:C-type mannose receptor 2-like [Synchiropus splendidus]|uniref:C-type mannose receptor 2-like n=1 Tax=Synchiropus splendidus TaxID=270530 RepID=UPI00237E5246|nr:C-type mannose receptor 2-like [Synchiropus splendidus]